uniref:Hexosyltransferase n=1 Tax=Steinernema glaseri TaxID=37863 RepID=A0A1I8A0E0_9BILA
MELLRKSSLPTPLFPERLVSEHSTFDILVSSGITWVASGADLCYALMMYGARTGVPLCVGLSIGVLIALLTSDFSWQPSVRRCPAVALSEPSVPQPVVDYVDNAEHWKVVVKKPPSTQPNAHQDVPHPGNQLIRARYAATELGIREKLIVVVLGQSSLSVALNASIGRHVPRVQLFFENSRIDAELATMANISPYRPNGQHAHVSILNSIFNQSFHENYDWFLLIPDTSYVNPFRLNDIVNHVNWNVPRVLGVANAEGNCMLQGGILLSNPALQSLIQQRHLCNSIVKPSDPEALEQCIRHATNLSCSDYVENYDYRWWKVEDSGEAGGASAVHDRVLTLSKYSGFNESLTVSPLLSDADARTLHEHFVRVEIAKLDEEIKKLDEESRQLGLANVDGPSWPTAVPAYSKAPNRYQVPKWEYFEGNVIFRNKPNQNVEPLEGNDFLDVKEVTAVAKAKVAEDPSSQGLTFVRLRNGYRIFDPRRGMDYMVDLVYRSSDDLAGDAELIVKRVHVCRPIVNTKIMHQVPYVKEDTDVTVVVPIQSTDDVAAFRKFARRHRDLCVSSPVDSRQTRIAVVMRGVDAAAARTVGSELGEIKATCKSWQMDTTILLLRSEKRSLFAVAALDAAVDHYGNQMIYLYLSPYADFQKEFYDRIRINTIKHFQIYVPIPFSEFHPQIVNAYNVLTDYEDKIAAGKSDSGSLADNMFIDNEQPVVDRLKRLNMMADKKKAEKPLVVHKDQGAFDTNDFSVFAVYGDDYVQMLDVFREKHGEDALTNMLDLAPMFISHPSIHILRAVEPTLRLRYRPKVCSNRLPTADYARCVLSRSETLATKAQLAKIIFSHLSGKS